MVDKKLVCSAKEALRNLEEAKEQLCAAGDYLCRSQCWWLREVGRMLLAFGRFPMMFAAESLQADMNGQCPHDSARLLTAAVLGADKSRNILIHMLDGHTENGKSDVEKLTAIRDELRDFYQHMPFGDDKLLMSCVQILAESDVLISGIADTMSGEADEDALRETLDDVQKDLIGQEVILMNLARMKE